MTFRVLRPGGRLDISDVVADDHLTIAERSSYVSCIAGALTFTEYREGLQAAGFAGVEITPTFEATVGMHSPIVRAYKPAEAVVVPVAAQGDLMIKKRGRNLRSGQSRAWTEEWFNGHGLHRLRGTVRYPRTA